MFGKEVIDILNIDYIKSLPLEELAKLSIYCTTEPDYDYNYDDELYECGTCETWHSTFTNECYGSYDDALNYTIEWLKEEYQDCNTCTNYTEPDEVDNGCYMCCKGYENNYERRI